jgi:hypothetical protein
MSSIMVVKFSHEPKTCHNLQSPDPQNNMSSWTIVRCSAPLLCNAEAELPMQILLNTVQYSITWSHPIYPPQW